MKRFSWPQSFFVAALCLAALPGCDRFDEDGVWVREGCDNGQRVEFLRPFEDRDDAYVGSWIVGEVECEAPEMTLVVERQGGAEVPGEITSHRSNRQLRLRPADYLVPNSTYIARMDTEEGHREWRFGTSATGTAVGAAVANVTAAGRGEDGTLLEPSGAGPLLVPELGSWQPALQLLSDVAGGRLTARLGAWVGEEGNGTQDGDRSTRDLDLTWDDPHFTSDPVDLRLRLENLTVVLEDATLGGAVQPGAAGLTGLWIEGRWDTRDAQAALGNICQAEVDAEGEGCVACRDGEALCLPFLVVHVPQVPWPGELVEVN